MVRTILTQSALRRLSSLEDTKGDTWGWLDAIKNETQRRQSWFINRYPCYTSVEELTDSLCETASIKRSMLLRIDVNGRSYYPFFQVKRKHLCPIIQHSLQKLKTTELEHWDFVDWLTRTTYVELFHVELKGDTQNMSNEEFEKLIFEHPAFLESGRTICPILALRTEPEIYWRTFDAWVSPDSVTLPTKYVELSTYPTDTES